MPSAVSQTPSAVSQTLSAVSQARVAKGLEGFAVSQARFAKALDGFAVSQARVAKALDGFAVSQSRVAKALDGFAKRLARPAKGQALPGRRGLETAEAFMARILPQPGPCATPLQATLFAVQVLGLRFQVPGLRFQVSGSPFPVPRSPSLKVPARSASRSDAGGPARSASQSDAGGSSSPSWTPSLPALSGFAHRFALSQARPIPPRLSKSPHLPVSRPSALRPPLSALRSPPLAQTLAIPLSLRSNLSVS